MKKNTEKRILNAIVDLNDRGIPATRKAIIKEADLYPGIDMSYYLGSSGKLTKSGKVKPIKIDVNHFFYEVVE